MSSQPNHEAGADAAASSMRRGIMTYPRLRIRRNSLGTFDAYLLRTRAALPIWISTGATIAAARAWLPERVEGA